MYSRRAQIGARGVQGQQSDEPDEQRGQQVGRSASPPRAEQGLPGCIRICGKAASRIAAVAEVGRPSASRVPGLPPAAVGQGLRDGEPLDGAGPAELGIVLPIGEALLRAVGEEGGILGAAGGDHPEWPKPPRSHSCRALRKAGQRDLCPVHQVLRAAVDARGHVDAQGESTVTTTRSKPSNSSQHPQVPCRGTSMPPATATPSMRAARPRVIDRTPRRRSRGTRRRPVRSTRPGRRTSPW